MRRYLKRVAIWLTQSLNTLFGPVFDAALFIAAKRHERKTGFWPRPAWFGDEDETTSSVLGKNSEWSGTCRWICRRLDKLFGEEYHCISSIETDEGTPWKTEEKALD